MNAPTLTRAASALAVLLAAAGAPFAAGWGALALAAAVAAGITALRGRAALPRAARVATWTATLGAGLVLLMAFTLRAAAPNIVIAGNKANERIAVSTLRTVLWAQDRAQARWGRPGLLAELAAPGGALLLPVFEALSPTPTGTAALVGGYRYAVWIPGAEGAPATDGAGRPAPGTNAWVAYAWPELPGASGGHVFCINQDEDILESDNDAPGQGYSGTRRAPAWDACLAGGALGGRLEPGIGGDGGAWRRWRGRETRRARSAR